MLASIGLVSCLYGVFRLLAALIRYAQTTPADAAPIDHTPVDTARPAAAPSRLAADLPVIAAAVAAMLEMDSHRIVHIEEVPHGQAWSAQGRWLQQSSHHPH